MDLILHVSPFLRYAALGITKSMLSAALGLTKSMLVYVPSCMVFCYNVIILFYFIYIHTSFQTSKLVVDSFIRTIIDGSKVILKYTDSAFSTFIDGGKVNIKNI